MKNNMFKIIDDKTFIANWQFLGEVNPRFLQKKCFKKNKKLAKQIKQLNIYIESLLKAYWRWQKKHGIADSKEIS